MRLEPPKTKEDFLKVKQTIKELLDNPYTDYNMFINLLERLKEVNDKINSFE